MSGRNKGGFERILHQQRPGHEFLALRLVCLITALLAFASETPAQVNPITTDRAARPCGAGVMKGLYDYGLVSFTYPAAWKEVVVDPAKHEQIVEFSSTDRKCGVLLIIDNEGTDGADVATQFFAIAALTVDREPHEMRVRGVKIRDERGGNAGTAVVIGPTAVFLTSTTLLAKIGNRSIWLNVHAPDEVRESLSNMITGSLVFRSSPLRKPVPRPLDGPGPAMIDTCSADNVIGNWQANVSVDVPRVEVDVSFTFRPGGTYSYTAGQGSVVWTSHDGSYSLAPNGGDQYYRCLLTLTPDPATIRRNPQNRYGLMPLQARNLMADRPKTFRVSDVIVPGQLVFFDASLARGGIGVFSLESVR